ncbi:MAG: pentapeptide repeat-containing protein [Fischerella sp. CENA71]|nr:pentapeptide repeat-containing protein [Fischerella sp. CENA71]
MPLDFSRQNLRGRSFKGQNLEGANFSGADIRGADFSNANLRGAKFTGAKAGLQNRWTISLVIFSLLLEAVSGFISAVSGAAIGLCLISGDLNYLFAGVVSLVVLAVFLIVAVDQNLVAAFRFLLMAGTIAIAVAVLGALTAVVVEEAAVTVAAAVAVVGTGFLVTGVVVLGAVAVALSGLGTMIGAVLATVIVIVTLAWLRVAVVVKAVTATGAMILAGAAASAGTTVTLTVTMAGAVAVAVGVTASSTYVGRCAFFKGQKQAFIRNIAVAIATTFGTSFQRSNLTNADFSQTILKSTDFRGAKLNRTYWFQAQKLDYARLGESYLLNPKVQQLVITNDGQDQNFDRLDLCSINLRGANLKDASFVSTDLNKANLQDTDLSRSKLVQTQLDATDLTGATLTGATIEDWGITNHTKLHGVRCEYVFMRLPTKEDPNPHRKPDNWEEKFSDGDFADFIKPIVDTLDLYHNQGVDPRAIAIAFKQLAENNPDAELEIVAMEKRGQDKFLLRAKTAETADKSELSAEYFDTYNEIKALTAREIKLLVAEKENQIRRLENMVMTALERPSFYSENRTINMGDGNYNEDIQGDYIKGDYSEYG